MGRHKRGDRRRWWDNSPGPEGNYMDNGKTRVFSRHHGHVVHDNAPDLSDVRNQSRNRSARALEVNSPGPRTEARSRGWFDAAGNIVSPGRKKK